MRTVSHEAGDQHDQHARDTETYWAGRARRDPGAISVQDYVRAAEPHLIVLSKLSLRWMLFSLFVAGLCCGMLAGKVLS